ncbi:cilia- and flagella-associated protein 52 isoform X3 [Vespa velutina]|uniref:cilia- and flagella-associated protein 52 isoform X3 n=1 Tax=Vespa velutina TaxID=202808 RepID=UPI001FB371D6|nr:cilia- and flagella-associated protein 52 isoform X3 [Vespa velutina]
MDIKPLDIIGIIGFDGVTKNALRLHPDQEHMIYPMGNKVTIKNVVSSEQSFLTGHTNLISAVCVSPCGNFVASGQINHLGFKAMVIVWDYHNRTVKSSYEIHKVRVEDVCFTLDSNYLISLGGRDDGNVVIWDVRNNDAMCGSFASNEIAGNTYTITRMNKHEECFLTAGDRTLKVWRIDSKRRKIYGVNVKVGKLRRSINCIVINENDTYAYCGTSSGDIIKARLNYRSEDEEQAESVMIGCYSKMYKGLKKVNQAKGEIECYAGGVEKLLLLNDEKMIVGAGDGTVELIEIMDIDFSKSKFAKLPSTPQIKTVRIWDIKPDVQRLVSILKEHRGPVTSLCISSNNEDLISSSTDGTCIIWDVIRCARKQVLMGNTMYMAACFSPNSIQILTCGTDRKIGYWETWDASLVREIEGSTSGSLNCIDISPDGQYFVTGSNDCIVKLWEYHTANVTHIGIGHAAIITSCKFSPNGEHMVSVSADGAIIIWKSPFTMARVKTPSVKSKSSTARTATVKPEESEVKCDNLKLDDLEGEHVAGINQMDETAESVRTTYHGDDQPQPCTRDPAGIPSPICSCIKDKDTTSVKSLKVQNPIEVSSGGCHCAKNITETKSLLSTKRSSVKPIETAKSASSSQRRASLQSNKKSVLKSKVSTERKSLQ